MNRYMVAKRSWQVIIAGFLLFYAFGIFAPNQVEGHADVSCQKYIVQQGDTIWDIACSMINDKKDDPREYICAIQKMNNFSDSVINPGDVLLLPKVE